MPSAADQQKAIAVGRCGLCQKRPLSVRSTRSCDFCLAQDKERARERRRKETVRKILGVRHCLACGKPGHYRKTCPFGEGDPGSTSQKKETA